MNPFENEDNNENNVVFSSQNITIWKENRGRKINTYITGWNLETDELKQYIKSFKQTKGCNGSLKMEDGSPKIHFQGDKVIEFIEFMISKGVDENCITIKGQ